MPEHHQELKSAKVEYSESVRKVSRAADDASTTAPESIVGMRFVTTYNDTEDNYNGFFTVSEGTDGGIVLNNFAEGYSVNATYDASTGKISIPTGVVIGTHSTYGDITLYALPMPTSIPHRTSQALYQATKSHLTTVFMAKSMPEV